MDELPLIVRPPAPGRDPDGSRLRTTLESHFAYERARNLRLMLVHLMLLPGAALWAVAAWPARAGEQLRGFALYAFALGCVGLLLAAASEWRWLRVRNRLSADLERSAQKVS